MSEKEPIYKDKTDLNNNTHRLDEGSKSNDINKSDLGTRFNVVESHLSNYKIKAIAIFKLLKRLPFLLLSSRFKEHQAFFESIQIKLRQARVPISYEMYVSNAVFFSIFSAFIGAISGLFLAYTLVYLVGLPATLTDLSLSQSIAWILNYRDLVISLLIVTAFTLIFFILVFSTFLIYPSFIASERKNKIDSQIPYAVTFMYAQSKGGMNIIEVLRELAQSVNTYGEVSKEVDVIIRDIDYFGNDLRTAIINSIELTPSERFQDLMYNLLAVIDAGGNISEYFQDKSEQYLEQASNDQKGFLETLGLLAESYVTAFVAGPLFIIIVGVMMAVMGSGSDVMLYALIYAILPIGSILFIVMISIITPEDGGKVELLETDIEKYDTHFENLAMNDGSYNDPLTEKEKNVYQFEQLRKSKKLLKIKSLFKNPMIPLVENPHSSLVITIPIAFIVAIVPLLTNFDNLHTTSDIVSFIDDKVLLAAYITIVPLSFFHEIKFMKTKRFEKNLPDFLKKLASANETGMTLKDSIQMILTSNPKSMDGEISKIWRDINWGVNITDSLIRFANRTKTRLIARSFTLITKALESSGDIGEVLRVAARDATAYQNLKSERTMNMMIYIVIIYIAYFVFVGVIYVVSSTFLEEMAAAGERLSSTGHQVGFLSTFDLDSYTQLFKHAAIIQGFSSGLLAGAMGEGNVTSGLKHSIVLMSIGFFLFAILI
ncbi:type II secretion system F family protein [Methanosalsum natronophilum]|uniref:Secretion system protein n=1 Tax=Methanosalsum natronophilum TaxID=768733 RepID=A0A3R7WF33_9EURY|nr:type II secretion system F family protein [Methanosalsum natronophilum]MCS3923082.1 flagellar protein FlaJ [Methanosalsum natronophilum]RQD88213.1 MAG: secretion system protein [Methanosalsum natronophilum]